MLWFFTKIFLLLSTLYVSYEENAFSSNFVIFILYSIFNGLDKYVELYAEYGLIILTIFFLFLTVKENSLFNKWYNLVVDVLDQYGNLHALVAVR